MRRFLWIGLVVLLSAAANASVVDPKLIAANNDFGVRLLKKLTAAERGKNVFISPASISLALSMTYNGADGSTKDDMAKTLGYQGLSLGQINSGNTALLANLSKPGAGVKLEIANSLWAREGVSFKPDFMAQNKKFYSAKIAALPFDSKAPGIINGWVSQKTHGKIKKIVDGQIDPQSILFLINAVYFDGKWSSVFKPEDTRDADFNLSSGKKKTVKMMGQEFQNLRYFKTPDAAVACLPYKGGRFSLWIVLPDKATGLSDLIKSLDNGTLSQWIAASAKKKVYVQLPRFKIEYGRDLNAELAGLGMSLAFDPIAANFKRMCPIPPVENVYIGKVRHKTFLEVDEQGTKAAAITMVEAVCECAPNEIDRTIYFYVDHPFLCLIRDNQTKSILFIGAVEKP